MSLRDMSDKPTVAHAREIADHVIEAYEGELRAMMYE